METTAPVRFASPELAEKIAKNHNTTVQTVKVKMVGQKDISNYIRQIKAAQKKGASSTFRSK